MAPDQIINIISIFSQPHFLVKTFLVVLAIFYLVFSVVVYRQISLMTQTLNSSVSPMIKTIALVQIGGVLFMFFLVLVLA